MEVYDHRRNIEAQLNLWNQIKHTDFIGPHLDVCANIVHSLVICQDFDFLDLFLNELGSVRLKELQNNEKFLRAFIGYKLKRGECNEVYTLLETGRFSSTEGLLEIWDEAHYIEKRAQLGRELTALIRYKVRQKVLYRSFTQHLSEMYTQRKGGIGFPPPMSVCPDGKRPSAKLPVHAVAVLKQWLNEHFDSPYPSEAEKEELATTSCLSLYQVKTWFANARRRIKNINNKQTPTSKGSAAKASPTGSDKASVNTSVTRKIPRKQTASSLQQEHVQPDSPTSVVAERQPEMIKCARLNVPVDWPEFQPSSWNTGPGNTPSSQWNATFPSRSLATAQPVLSPSIFTFEESPDNASRSLQALAGLYDSIGPLPTFQDAHHQQPQRHPYPLAQFFGHQPRFLAPNQALHTTNPSQNSPRQMIRTPLPSLNTPHLSPYVQYPRSPIAHHESPSFGPNLHMPDPVLHTPNAFPRTVPQSFPSTHFTLQTTHPPMNTPVTSSRKSPAGRSNTPWQPFKSMNDLREDGSRTFGTSVGRQTQADTRSCSGVSTAQGEENGTHAFTRDIGLPPGPESARIFLPAPSHGDMYSRTCVFPGQYFPIPSPAVPYTPLSQQIPMCSTPYPHGTVFPHPVYCVGDYRTSVWTCPPTPSIRQSWPGENRQVLEAGTFCPPHPVGKTQVPVCQGQRPREIQDDRQSDIAQVCQGQRPREIQDARQSDIAQVCQGQRPREIQDNRQSDTAQALLDLSKPRSLMSPDLLSRE